MGRVFRRAEARDAEAFQADRRAINDKVRLLARLGEALVEARELGGDLDAAVSGVISWDRLASSVEEAKRLIRPDMPDLAAVATRGLPVGRVIGPALLAKLTFKSVPAAASLLRALEILEGLLPGRATRLAAAGADRLHPPNLAQVSWHPR